MTAPLPKQAAAEDDDQPGADLALLSDHVGRTFLGAFEGVGADTVGTDGLVRFLTANAAPDAMVEAVRAQQRQGLRT